MSAARRRVHGALALLSASGAVIGFAAGGAPAQAPPAAGPRAAQGRALFAQACASCHGQAAGGRPGLGPSLRGVGALAADFYLRTGRMPLRDPGDQPRRARPRFTRAEIDALVAYVGSLGGPRVPRVHPSRGDVATGMQLFAASCMGCHQIQGRGGITTGAVAPALQQATAVQVAEAMAIGPYVMPQFRGQFSQREIDSIARYVLSTRKPQDVGGWGLGNIGPIPEGMVTWLLAIVALLLVMRLIGERTTR